MTEYFIPDNQIESETEEVWTGSYEEAFGSGQVSILNLMFPEPSKWRYGFESPTNTETFGIHIKTDLVIPGIERFKVKED